MDETTTPLIYSDGVESLRAETKLTTEHMCKKYNVFAKLRPAETTPEVRETENEASKDCPFEMKVESDLQVDEVLDQSRHS